MSVREVVIQYVGDHMCIHAKREREVKTIVFGDKFYELIGDVECKYIGCDCIPIEVGEEVWHTNYHDRGTVVRIADGKVSVMFECLGMLNAYPEELSHSMPEELKKWILKHGMCVPEEVTEVYEAFREEFVRGKEVCEESNCD